MVGCVKEDIVLYINQKKHPNYADYLTKFNITDDTPQQWLDLQTQLLDASWLQNHPDTWYRDALQESKLYIQKQASGNSNDNPSQTHHIDVNKPPPIKMCPTEQDWSMIEALINRQRLCPLKSIFRMIGWTTLIALKWLDNTRVKIFRAKNRPSCTHTTNNCRCVHDYYKGRTGSRPFATTFTPPKENGVFLPSPPEV